MIRIQCKKGLNKEEEAQVKHFWDHYWSREREKDFWIFQSFGEIRMYIK